MTSRNPDFTCFDKYLFYLNKLKFLSICALHSLYLFTIHWAKVYIKIASSNVDNKTEKTGILNANNSLRVYFYLPVPSLSFPLIKDAGVV